MVYQKKNIKWFLFILTVILTATTAFYFNLLYPSGQSFFDGFQQDSEHLIEARITAQQGFDAPGYGVLAQDGTFNGANSHFALQGRVLSSFYHRFGFADFELLNLLCCISLAITLTVMCWLLYRRYGKLFAVTFFAVSLLSPWMVAMARNLYWVEFLMFLPAVFVLLLMDAVDREKRWWPFLILIFFFSMIRFLCGYEFTSTIMLFAVSFPFAKWIMIWRRKLNVKEGQYRNDIKKWFLILVLISLSLLAGFAAAILIHADTRGDTLLEGLRSIWENDVLRRTVSGNANEFPTVYFDSLVASPLEVVGKYVFQWSTPVIAGLPNIKLAHLFLLSLCAFFFKCRNPKERYTEINVLYFFFLLTALSWLILGKSHSYIHTHINYIVWYFGCVQVWCYFILRAVYDGARKLLSSHKDIRLEIPKQMQIPAIVIGLVLVIVLSSMSIPAVRLMHSVDVVNFMEEEGTMLYDGGNEKIMVSNGNMVITEEKGSEVRKDVYYVHIYPHDVAALPVERQQYGFDNYDFTAGTKMLQLPFWYDCEAERLSLPAYAIKSIWIGKSRHGEVLWECEYTFPQA